MPALTPSFTFDFESSMQAITENEFVRLIASGNLWWRKVARVRPTGKKRDIIAWLLSTAQIYDAGISGGNMKFDDMAATYQEYDVRNSAAGLKLTRNQIEDNDGDGFDFASEWSSQMGAKMAYWPQAQVANFIMNGAMTAAQTPQGPIPYGAGPNGTGLNIAYDGVQFFADNLVNSGNGHPLNQFKTGAGKYFNWFHGAASGVYPGALPIDESVGIDVALTNLQKATAYIASIKMPDGVTPRFLKPVVMLHAPRLAARAQTLNKADFIGLGTGSAGAGSATADIRGIIKKWGYAEPIEAQEFAGITLPDGANADTTWYLICQEMTTTQLGGLVYVDREPYRITYYTGTGGGTGVDAVLDRARELEWHLQGRNLLGPGHPFTVFRFDAS